MAGRITREEGNPSCFYVNVFNIQDFYLEASHIERTGFVGVKALNMSLSVMLRALTMLTV